MSDKNRPGPAPDEKQQKAISCNVNAVVSAGAGSGKTFVLTERYFRLVAEGRAGVDQILTLTFTRKAAAEMFERIYHRLLTEKDSSPRVMEQLRKFDEAQISTLDSFCSGIASSGAGLLGITPDFQVDNAGAGRLVEKTALEFILRHAGNPVLSDIIVEYGFERVWRSFFTSYGFEHINCAALQDFSDMETKQYALLNEKLKYHWKGFRSAAGKIMSLDPAEGKSIENNMNALSGLADMDAAFAASDFSLFTELVTGCSFSKLGISRSKKEAVVLLADYIDECREHQEPLLNIAAGLKMWSRNKEMFLLLREFQEEVVKEKRRTGLLTYSDVLHLAIEILKKDRSIRNYYKAMFRYIMIDEFQDNNSLQKQLLFMLAEKPDLFEENPRANHLEQGKLFFVGDDKQSIYRFRGADVSVFKQLCDELTGEEGAHIEMDRNYRSSTALIGFYNSMFHKILRGGEPYEADFSSLSAGSREQEQKAEITLLYKPYDEEEDGRERAGGDETEAYRIAEYIKTSVQNKSLLIRDGKERRPAEYGDFALLMRSTGSQADYERIFRQEGIPYWTDNVRTLFLEAPFNDFYYLFQLAMFSGDRTAYAAYLRSPLTGCSDETVFSLLQRDGSPFPDADLEAGEQRLYEHGRELYFFIRDRINTWPIGRLVQYVWHNAGYRYYLLTVPANHPYMEYYDYLYYRAMDADKQGLTMSEFLDFMRTNLGKYERIDDIDMISETGAGVQILTIHKSKGLEFPVVIVANTGNKGAGGRGDALYYVSSRFGITFNVSAEIKRKDNYFFSLLREEENKKEIAELKRLFYVACTRAEDHLLISGYHHRNNQNVETAMLNMVLQAFHVQTDTLPRDSEETDALFSIREMKSVSKSLVLKRRQKPDPGVLRKKIHAVTVLPVSSFTALRQEYSVTELVSEKEQSGEGKVSSQTVLPDIAADPYLRNEKTVTAFGTLAHYAMEHTIRGDFSWDDLPEGLLEEFPKEGLPAIRESVHFMVTRFEESSFMEQVQNAERMETELDFFTRYERAGEKEGREFFVRGRIDLYFESESHAFVVDFKTDKYFFPDLHTKQLTVYARGAESCSGKPVRCFICFLRTGEIKEVFPDPVFIPELPKEGTCPACQQ